MFKKLLQIAGMSSAMVIAARESLTAYQDLQKDKAHLKAVQDGKVRLMSEDFYKDAIKLDRQVVGFYAVITAVNALGIYKTTQELTK